MRKKVSTQGFTMVELMIALAVIAMLLAIAVPSFESLVNKNQLETVTSEFVNVIKGARERAVTSGEEVSIIQDNDSIECNYDGETADDPCASYQVRYGEVSVADDHNFKFSPTGMLDSEDASINVSITHGEVPTHRYEVSILSSGRVSIRQINI